LPQTVEFLLASVEQLLHAVYYLANGSFEEHTLVRTREQVHRGMTCRNVCASGQHGDRQSIAGVGG
jgi:hypothetical protein